MIHNVAAATDTIRVSSENNKIETKTKTFGISGLILNELFFLLVSLSLRLSSSGSTRCKLRLDRETAENKCLWIFVCGQLMNLRPISSFPYSRSTRLVNYRFLEIIGMLTMHNELAVRFGAANVHRL